MGSIAQTSCASLLVMMVAMYCLIAVVATGTVPGIKWSHFTWRVTSAERRQPPICCHALQLLLLGYDDDDSHGLAHLQHSTVGPEST